MKKHHVSGKSQKKLQKRFLRASKDNSPEKVGMNCLNVVTVPQSNLNTCWFNAVLMVFLFSDGMRTVCKKALGPLANRKINPGVNDILQRLISLLLMYKQPQNSTRRQIYEKSFNYGIKPEDILKSIDAYAPGQFPKDVIDGTSGGYPDKATLALMMLFSLKAKFYSLGQDVDGYYMTDISHMHSPRVVADRDPDMLIIYRHYYEDLEDLPKVRIASLQRPSLLAFGRRYTLDSSLLSSLSKNRGHAIAGITCNGTRMMYNGWTSNSTNKKTPCPLIPVDWTEKGLYLQKNNQSNTCYTLKRTSPSDYKFDATRPSQAQIMVYT